MKANLRALTTREWEVLNHLANGQRNHDIANELGISSRTVPKHLQRIYAKLGVTGRTAAALYMVRAAAKLRWVDRTAMSRAVRLGRVHTCTRRVGGERTPSGVRLLWDGKS